MNKKPDTKTEPKVGGVDGEVGVGTGRVLGAILVGALLAASFVIGRFTAPTVVEVREPEIFIEEYTEPEDGVGIGETVPEIIEEVEPVVTE